MVSLLRCVCSLRKMFLCSSSTRCNGADTCGSGSCSVHAGNPCTGGAVCRNICDEAVGLGFLYHYLLLPLPLPALCSLIYVFPFSETVALLLMELLATMELSAMVKSNHIPAAFHG